MYHFHPLFSMGHLQPGEQVEVHLCRSSADGGQFVLLWQILAGEQLLGFAESMIWLGFPRLGDPLLGESGNI